jgi:LPXTG-site transpeptidase (sortase) family protein
VRVTIPSIGVSSPLTKLGLDADGAMEVPVEASLAGWYAKGPAPGALGPAVIAGHVTWDRQPAVFYRLSQLSQGDIVKVAREDGQTAIFSVQRVDQYPKERFPTRAVYGVTDHASLRLITCGGSYDEAASRYLDNVVAFAELVDVRTHGS